MAHASKGKAQKGKPLDAAKGNRFSDSYFAEFLRYGYQGLFYKDCPFSQRMNSYNLLFSLSVLIFVLALGFHDHYYALHQYNETKKQLLELTQQLRS
jgi:hypothetical protein